MRRGMSYKRMREIDRMTRKEFAEKEVRMIDAYLWTGRRNVEAPFLLALIIDLFRATPRAWWLFSVNENVARLRAFSCVRVSAEALQDFA